MSNEDYLNMFLSAKDIEGCSSKTLKYYKDIILKFIKKIEKPIQEITTDDMRLYFSQYKSTNGCGLATMDNIRRVFLLSSASCMAVKNNDIGVRIDI